MTFQPALALNRAFYAEVVGPLLAGVDHSAARIGWGSEVLGFDTARSTDHGWGPQLQVFVAGEQVDAVTATLDAALPDEFAGWPVRYGWDAVVPRHHVYVSTLSSWLRARLGLDPSRGMEARDWLRIPQQRLREVTAGAVYADASGAVNAVRSALAYFPDDVWRWMIACQWKRIAQEEAFVGRAAEVGDELGSRVVAGRLARELMRMWFLFSREYWPYTKWFGSAFARLADSAPLDAALRDAVVARDYPAREAALVRAYAIVATRHNELGVSAVVDPAPREYYGRPFAVLMADRFADACVAEFDGSPFEGLPLLGSIDQFVDSTDVLSDPDTFHAVAAAYDTLLKRDTPEARARG